MNKQIDRVSFDLVSNRIRRFWNPYLNNPHIGFLATSRSGKSYLIRHGLLPLVPHDRIVLIDVKRGGELTWDGWGNDVTELKPGFFNGDNGRPHYRVMLTPTRSDKLGRDQVKSILEIIMNEGECIIVMDDSRKITARDAPNLNLSSYVDELLTLGAANGVSVILAANSSVWATSGLKDQCGTYFVGGMTNKDQLKAFADIAGLGSEYYNVIDTLKRREFVYTDRHEGTLVSAITGLPED